MATRNSNKAWQGLGDGLIMDCNSNGVAMYCCYKEPTETEISDFQNSKFELALTEFERIALITIKCGEGNYGVCPFIPSVNPAAAKDFLACCDGPIVLRTTMIDTSTGVPIISSDRPLSEEFTAEFKRWLGSVLSMRKMQITKANESIKKLTDQYTVEQIREMANAITIIG